MAPSRTSRRGGSGSIGIALSDRLAVAVLQGNRSGPSARASWTPPSDATQLGAELERTFRELKGVLETRAGRSLEGAEVNVALLPPLADTRVIPLPPLDKTEAEAVLTRDAPRYFLGATRPQVVSVRLPPAGARTPDRSPSPPPGAPPALPPPVLATAAPLALLETLLRALEEVGWRVRTLGAGEGAWLSAASKEGETAFGGIVARVGEGWHVLTLADSHPQRIRRLGPEDLGALGQALGSGPGQVLVLAAQSDFEAVRESLRGQRWSAVPDPEGWDTVEEGTAAQAGKGPLALQPPSLKEKTRRRWRKTALLMAATGLVLLLASAAVQLWGAHRELAALQERRALIRDQVAPLLSARDSLQSLNRRVETLEALDRSTPVWSRTIVEITALLPRNTYLTGFFASGDTLELEAAGTEAAEAIQILRESGLFQDLRLQGMVERELDDGETVEERFSLRGRVPLPPGGGTP